MSEISKTLPKRVKDRLEIVGKTMRAVSMEIGAHAGYVRDLLDPERFSIPSAARMELLATALSTTTDYLMGTASSPDQVQSEVTLRDVRRDWAAQPRDIPGIPLVGAGDCADLEITTEDGQVVLLERSSFDPDYQVSIVARPPALIGDMMAYAIYFHGDSMEPRFEAGEVGIVQPSRPAAPGDYVVVQLTDGNGGDVISVIVKRMVRQTANYVELEQLNPSLIFRLPRAQVARIHRISTTNDLVFS